MARLVLALILCACVCMVSGFVYGNGRAEILEALLNLEDGETPVKKEETEVKIDELSRADILEAILDLKEERKSVKKDKTEVKRDELMREVETQERKTTELKEALLGKRASLTDLDACQRMESAQKGPFVMCGDPVLPGFPACVWGSYICDSVIDCLSAKDEFQLNHGCLKSDDQCKAEYPQNGYFRCADRFLCIDNCHVCDGNCDCIDGSDEDNCAEIKVTCGTYDVDTCKNL